MDLKYFAYRTRKMSSVVVKIVAESTEFIPVFHSNEAAGADIRSSIDAIIAPNKVEMISAGFKCEIPAGYHAKITARSSMGKKGIIVPNGPGIIDSDYRGDIRVLLLNLSGEPFEIKRGDRIAQWLLEKNVQYVWQVVETLNQTDRDPAGFGTTGRN